MAQVKLLKIGTSGVPKEISITDDDISANSFTADGGPSISSAGIDMNDTNISELNNLSFNDSASQITNNAGTFDAEDMMFESRENVMESGGAILFPTITDSADLVDQFRLPALAGVPSATPSDGGEGYQVWDSTNDKLYIWNGASWTNTFSSALTANQVVNSYTADEALTLGDALYISAADNVSKAVVTSEAAGSRVIGLAKASASDTASVEVVSEGVFTGLTGLTAGAIYYVDPGTAGGRTTTIPSSSGHVIVQLGYAKSTTALHLNIQQLGIRA